eukprot:2747332-Prymnesium_polylepis.1
MEACVAAGEWQHALHLFDAGVCHIREGVCAMLGGACHIREGVCHAREGVCAMLAHDDAAPPCCWQCGARGRCQARPSGVVSGAIGAAARAAPPSAFEQLFGSCRPPHCCSEAAALPTTAIEAAALPTAVRKLPPSPPPPLKLPPSPFAA